MKLCFRCKHIDVDYDGPWSDVTPGSGFSMKCRKDHFSLGQEMELKEYREAMEKGLDCEDFEKAED